MLLMIGSLSLATALGLVVFLLSGREPVVARESAPESAVGTHPSTSPLSQRAAAIARRLTAANYPERLQARLDTAGNPAAWPVTRVMTLKGVGLVGGLVVGGIEGLKFGGLLVVLVPVGAAAFCFFLPDIWIRNLGDRRKAEIRLGLPDVVDLLTVCVEAGLGFDAALARVAANLDGPAPAEFSRVMQEMQIGKSRIQALRDAAERTDVAEFRAFISSVVQSTELGISMGDVLRAQAGQMRIRRRQLAEEKAQKLPVKVLPPLMLCILPSLFIVVLGPAALNIVRAFSHT